ncbi:MAG TPA: hypothetical protein VG820_12080 [Fimbriimonadaceae bacterium]|nr:hypothetical protein [Fimbriimonadaceae bacterium]
MMIKDLVSRVAKEFGFRGSGIKLFRISDGVKQRLKLSRSTVANYYTLIVDIRLMRSPVDESRAYGNLDEGGDFFAEAQHLMGEHLDVWQLALDGRSDMTDAEREAHIRRGFEIGIVPLLDCYSSVPQIKAFLLNPVETPRYLRIWLSAYQFFGIPRPSM